MPKRPVYQPTGGLPAVSAMAFTAFFMWSSSCSSVKSL